MNILLERRRSALNAKKIPWDDIVIQTLDMTKDGYNPAVAIILNSNNFGTVLSNPITSGRGRYYITKAETAAITDIGSMFVNAITVVDEDAIVSNDNTVTYDFTSFDEFKYFGVTILKDGFDGCSKLESVYTHNITSLTKNKNAFRNCSKLKNLYLDNLIPGTAYANSIGNFNNTGDGTGIFVIKGPSAYTTGNSNLGTYLNIKFRKIVFNGAYTNNYPQFDASAYYNEFYIRYALWLNGTGFGAGSDSQFYDIRDVFTGWSIVSSDHSNTIVHLAYDGMACGYRSIAAANRWYKVSKVYVGSGSSRQNDEDILALYLADTDWATYSSKLATWYDYNGEHKWYYVTNNLTNFINSNTVEWPYITRGESYNTTIVPTGNTPLNRVMVLMYEAVNDGVTPDNPTDITSQVYNPSTGEISIQSVTGNIIIEEFNEIKLHPTLLDSSRSLYQGYGWPKDGYYLVYKYADDSSMGDWRVNNTSGSNGYITFFINCSSIPENATILSVECAYRARIDGGCSSTTKLVCGNTVKSEESPTSTTSSIVTMNNAGIWTRSELDSCAIMFSINPNNLQQVKYMWLSGATLTVKYK